jgi:selenide,water dikinase
MPINKLPVDTIRAILAGGESVCRSIGIPVAGGHSIDSPEPIYGLVALGLAHPKEIKRNDGGRAGDRLILGKPLGIGVLSAALKKGQLDESSYAEMLKNTTQLNTPGTALASLSGVHAMTDVTGFGLLGHLLGVCRGSKVAARVSWDALPILSSALALAQAGFVTGASGRNWDSYGDSVELPSGLAPWKKNLLTDPQTSGGLLVACASAAVDRVLDIFANEGFGAAREIGSLEAGLPRIFVS